jgi:hypothetical protein
MLLFLRNMHSFHEHRSGGIYTISEIVSHVVLTTINSEGHFRSVSSYDINGQWRLIQHIDVVVETDDSKNNMLDPIVMRSNNFKDVYRIFDPSPSPSCKLAQPTYQTVVLLPIHIMYAP